MPWPCLSGAACDKLLGQSHQLHLTGAILCRWQEGHYTSSSSHQGVWGLQLNQLLLGQHRKVHRTTGSSFDRWSSCRCRKQEKNSGGYEFVSCGKQRGFPECSVCGSCIAHLCSFPRQPSQSLCPAVGLLYAELGFKKNNVTVTIETTTIDKLCCFKNAYLSTSRNSDKWSHYSGQNHSH